MIGARYGYRACGHKLSTKEYGGPNKTNNKRDKATILTKTLRKNYGKLPTEYLRCAINFSVSTYGSVINPRVGTIQ